MSIQAVIFDMDGVIVDTEPLYLAFNDAFFSAHGIRFNLEDQRRLIGRSHGFFEAIAEQNPGLSIPDLKEALLSAEADLAIDYAELKLSGIDELLEDLHQRGFRLAVASSSAIEKIEAVLHACGIRHYFDAVLTGEDTVHGKPDPEIFLKTADALHVLPEACLVIEDSTAGIEAGKRAGMQVIALAHDDYEMDLTAADEIVNHLSDIHL